MRPRNTTNSLLHRYGRNGQVQQLADLLVSKLISGRESSRFQNYFWRQDRGRLTGKKFRARALALDHIPVVIFFSSTIQMIWPHARRVITMMQNAKAVRDWPVVKFPRKHVGSKVIERSVAVRDAVRDPNPACVSLFDFSPKAAQLIARFTDARTLWFARTTSELRDRLNYCTVRALSFFFTYDSGSQDVNLREQVSFWLGSLEKSHSLAGRFVF